MKILVIVLAVALALTVLTIWLLLREVNWRSQMMAFLYAGQRMQADQRLVMKTLLSIPPGHPPSSALGARGQLEAAYDILLEQEKVRRAAIEPMKEVIKGIDAWNVENTPPKPPTIFGRRSRLLLGG